MPKGSFYTNVVCLGDYILHRGVENGRPFNIKHEFTPTLYVPSKKDTGWRSLEGDMVGPVKWGSIKETR